MAGLEMVSLKEAQFILGRPEADINRAIDRGYIDKLTEEVVEPAPSGKKRGTRVLGKRVGRKASRTAHRRSSLPVKRTVRKLGEAELVFLEIEGQLHGDLTGEGRRRLYDAIKAAPVSTDKVRVGPFEVETKAAVLRIRDRFRELRSLRSGILESGIGDPLIKGTDLSVYVIASLAEGQSAEEIVEDYPGLTTEQIDRAIAYAQAYPKKGRPYPTRSFKRMLGDLAKMRAFDGGSDPEEPLTPDMLR